MNHLRYCPSCSADLRGERISQESIDKGYYGIPCLDPYFYRTIGIYDHETDRTTHWQCPECSYRWERT